MIKKVFTGFVSFLAIFSLIALWLGYLGMIYSYTTVANILISGIITGFILKKTKKETITPKTQTIFALIIGVFVLLFLYVIFPNFIFPVTASDLMNHSKHTRLTSANHNIVTEENGFLSAEESFPFNLDHSYPQNYYATTSSIHSIIGNAYMINTILPILLLIFTTIGVFLFAKKFYNEKTAIISSFIFAFTITSLWVLLAGHLPQVFTMLFLISGFYFYSTKEKKPYFLSLIGLTAYPHAFLIFTIFLAFNFLKQKNFKIFILPFLALLSVIPQVFGLAIHYATYIAEGGLIRGGIFTPNPFSLAVFLLAIPGIIYIFKNKKQENNSKLLLFFGAFALMIFSVFARFFLNMFTNNFPVQIHQLYMSVKYFYLAIVPLSIIAAIGFTQISEKINTMKKPVKTIATLLVFGLLFWHFIYFTGYTPVIKNQPTFPVGFYSIGEKINSLPGEFVLGIDECFTKLPKYDYQPFPYNSFFDVPDSGENRSRLIQFPKIFQFSWAANFKYENGQRKIFDNKGKEVLKYSQKDADYFLTNCSELNEQILFQENGIKVYKMSN